MPYLNPTAGLLREAGGVVAVSGLIVEQGAGDYQMDVALPAGAVLIDIIVDGIALWGAGTSATLIVGDTDDDGFYTAVNLKATDLLAGESLAFALAGGKAGAYIANSQVSKRYSAAARTVSAKVAAAGTDAATGRTRVTVLYTVGNDLPVAFTEATP